MSNKPQAAGCVVYSSDIPLILATTACFLAFICYGACIGSVGAAIPPIAAHFGKTESSMGTIFTTRGIGYLIGTLSSGAILEYKMTTISKDILVSVCVTVVGIATGLLSNANNMSWLLFLFWVQGLAFGGIDTYANCLLPEIWGVRVQPWMQAMHACFGIGALIGPVFVGVYGYQPAFLILAFLCLLPLVFTAAYEVIVPYFNKSKGDDDNYDDVSSVNDGTNGDNLNDDAELTTDSEIATPQEIPVTNTIRSLLILFFFIYVGTEVGYGGWIATYALHTGVANSHSAAAFLVAIFWGFLSLGRMVAIPFAVVASNTTMFRFQLSLSLFSSILALTIAHISYENACIASAFLGFSLSSIFPLALTVPQDYGYLMDSTSITLCVVGACCGEASIPVIIGILMHTDGAAAMPVTVLTICCLLLIVYATLHFIMTVKQAAASNSEIEMNGNTVSPFHSEKETGFALDEGSRGSNNRPGHQSIPTCDPFTSSPLHVVA